MVRLCKHSVAWTLAGTLALAVALPRPHAEAAAPAASARWLTWNVATHTATLILIAGYSGANDDFNFNGYSKGKMVITVPVGCHMHVIFSNRGPYPHSAVITPYARKDRQNGYLLAFPGASTPDPLDGFVGKKIERFQFVASKPGTYAIVCGVPGHEQAGMWAVLRVVRGANPSLKL